MENRHLHELQFKTKGEELPSLLEVGDNFAIMASSNNDKGVDFYLICCSKGVHNIKVLFMCDWITSFETRNKIVCGTYYQKWGHADSLSYILLNSSKPVYHMLAIKFLMTPTNFRFSSNALVYSLPRMAKGKIISVIASIEVE